MMNHHSRFTPLSCSTCLRRLVLGVVLTIAVCAVAALAAIGGARAASPSPAAAPCYREVAAAPPGHRAAVRERCRARLRRAAALRFIRRHAVAATASCYGPGLYGNSTADGTTLTPSSVLVAHKSLPLGTRVAVVDRGRVVFARVRDRGPYAHGRTWDVSSGLARKLGYSGRADGCAAFGVRTIRVAVLRG